MDRPHAKRWRGFPGPRTNEKIGGGFFVFQRGRTTGRIKVGHIMRGAMPFEHPNLEAAIDEAARLSVEYGGQFEVFGSAHNA